MDEPRNQPGTPGGDSDSGSVGGDVGRRLGEEGGPVGLRVGRDPANLGDEVPESGDVTYPNPVDAPPDDVSM